MNDLERRIRDAEKQLKDAANADDRDNFRRKIRDLNGGMTSAQRRVRRLQGEAAAAGSARDDSESDLP